jgi:23S rRNA (guanosine2251-2'-O)-methyltransferase
MTRHKFDKRKKDLPGGKPGTAAPAAPEAARFSRKPSAPGAYWLYGKHAVMAALANPQRSILRLVTTAAQVDDINASLKQLGASLKRPAPEIMTGPELDRLMPPDSLHQGIAAETKPLPDLDLEEICALDDSGKSATAGKANLVLVLDQVTDPHNVGAIIRSSAAFGARAIVTTDRHAPPESGALAKSASGALEILPWVRVTNLAHALEDLARLGYWRLGLDGAADKMVEEVDPGRNVVLVLGSEGAGLRRGTVEHCDYVARLPISPAVESLNVSNAAAVALYALSRNRATT